MPASTVLLVHGAWHGAWCWEPTLEPLRELGLTPVTIDLPGHGESTEPLGDLHGDADAVLAALDQIGEPTLLVGHSYGGMVITDAGSHDAVAGLVYVCAFMPGADTTLLQEGPEQQPPAGEPNSRATSVVLSDDGLRMSIDPERAAETFYHDCDDDTQRWATARLGDQPTASFVQAPRSLAHTSKPSTYAVCTDDRTIPPWNQRRMSSRADEVVELDASHSPFLSRPDELARILAAAAAPG